MLDTIWNYEQEMHFFVIIQDEVKNITDEEVEAYKYSLSQSGVTGPINYYRNAMPPDLPQDKFATKIKAPTLVVWVSETTLCMHVQTAINDCHKLFPPFKPSTM